MSGGVLVIAEHLRGELRDVTRECVRAGVALKDGGAGPVAVALIASDPAALVAAASLEGVDEVIEVKVACEEFNADVYCQVVEALCRERVPAVTVAGSSVNGTAFGAGVAVRLGLGFAADVVACAIEDGELTARRQFYGGKVEAELAFPDSAPAILLLRPNTWALASLGGAPVVTSFAVALDEKRIRSRHMKLVDPPAGGLDITRSEVILAIGRGIGDRENVAQFEGLAERMGATLASSRPLVDAGWLPKDRQVGQSGKTVKPKVYLALGISGAVQHVAGMKGSETIVAVNSDPEAPIFGVARYGVVGDLFEIADELEKLW